ncbi:MAG: 8-oxo-dGTP diphosphatase MutT [Limisphaerales bacterium]
MVTGPSETIDVAAGVVFRQRRLLIAQRLPQDHLGGLWEFPGGKREPTETFEDCLRRELREELGIEVEVAALLGTITHHYPEKVVHLRFFRCLWRQNEPQALGCDAFAWVASHQLAGYAFPAADARILRRLQTEAQLWR